MIRVAREVEGGSRTVETGLLPVLVSALREAREGALVGLAAPADARAALETWARLTSHALVEAAPLPDGRVRYAIRKGRAPPEPEDVELGRRLWIYVNFDCNLACDYCCVRSSPAAPRRAMGADRVSQAAKEAAALGFSRVFLTGGEPMLLPDIDRVVDAAAAHLPVTLLTNAMLFAGSRRAVLEAMPRDRVTLQVSLDSPDAALHDAHRGAGSWAAARRGIATARGLGFRVRVAATVQSAEQADAMQAFLAAEGVPPEDRVVRPLALRGNAQSGLALARADLKPELTLTADGVYWHPVGAADDDLLVTRDPFPIEAALREARRLVAEDAAFADRVAEVFRCA